MLDSFIQSANAYGELALIIFIRKKEGTASTISGPTFYENFYRNVDTFDIKTKNIPAHKYKT